MTAGEKVYVFGGVGVNGCTLDTIEALDVSISPSSWKSILTPPFNKRISPCVCAISANRILICGGYYDVQFNDVMVFDTENNTAKKVATAPFAF